MKKFEIPIYLLIVLFFIGKYTLTGDGITDKDQIRRPNIRMPSVRRPVITAPNPATDPNSPLPRDTGPVMVKIDQVKKNSTGTGFAFDGFGQYITARHVTEGCQSVYVLTGPRRGQMATVTPMRNSDFSVLDTKNLTTPHITIAKNRPKRGDDGYFLGYPQGKPADVWAVAYGSTRMQSVGKYRMREPVTAWVERRRRPDFTGSLAGMSGGPAFNSQGEIIGTVVAGEPRRGRVFTTDIQNFDQFSALSSTTSNQITKPQINRLNFDSVGKDLRQKLTIAKIYCKAR